MNRRDLVDVGSIKRRQISTGRSSRVALTTAIGLSGQDRQKASFMTPARASNLNRHGATVQLSRELVIGSVVVVRNLRGTQVSARVTAKLPDFQEIPCYEIQFIHEGDTAQTFWGISFPSIMADLLTR